jgi:hypothetical protein
MKNTKICLEGLQNEINKRAEKNAMQKVFDTLGPLQKVIKMGDSPFRDVVTSYNVLSKDQINKIESGGIKSISFRDSSLRSFLFCDVECNDITEFLDTHDGLFAKEIFKVFLIECIKEETEKLIKTRL